MKQTALLATLLCLAQNTLHADVPSYINYQGKVADSSGLPIGATGTAASYTAAPTNRKIIFRIYSASTGGTPLWTEEQTATISSGVFSVLLGNGIVASGLASGGGSATLTTEQAAHTDLSAVFATSAARFLEIAVDSGDNTITAADVPISPRQQITSTAFAFHAKVADSIASASDLAINPVTGTASNYGLGWYGSGRTFNSISVDGPVLYGNAGGALGSNASGTKNIALAWNAAGQVGIGSTSSFAATNKLTLQGDDASTPAQQLVIRGNTDPTKRLNIGFDTTANQSTLQSYTAASTYGNLLLNPSGGNVGIGTATPGVPLTFASTLGDKISLWGQGPEGVGIGVALGALQIHGGNSGDDVAFGYGSSAAMTETMRVKGNGNVGIGTNSPGAKLDVNGNVKVAGGIYMGNGPAIYGNNNAGVAELCFWPRSSNGTYLNFGSNGFYIRNNVSSNIMTLFDNGNVGIGTSMPGYKLDVTGSSNVTGNLSVSGNVGIGTNSPGAKLEIADGSADGAKYGSLQITRPASGHLAAHLSFVRAGNSVVGLGYGQSTNMFGFGGGTTGAFSPSWLAVDPSTAFIGIGTTSPIYPLHVSRTVATIYNSTTSVTANTSASTPQLGNPDYYGANGSGNGSYTWPTCIWADGVVAGTAFFAMSDQRIKDVVARSSAASDLQLINQLQVTDYRLKDRIGSGTAIHKGFIAQEVRKLIPEAVSSSRNYIPDIYLSATQSVYNADEKRLSVTLAKPHALAVGDWVRIYGDDATMESQVLKVKSATCFVVASEKPVAKAFVYGRRVDDFLAVDYNRLFTTGIGAIQELDRQIKEKDARIATLEAKLATKADDDASQNTRLAALEKLLSKPAAAEPISVKRAGP